MPRNRGSGDGRGARRVRPPHSTSDRMKEAAVKRGEHIMAPAQLRSYNIDTRQEPVYRECRFVGCEGSSVYRGHVSIYCEYTPETK